MTDKPDYFIAASKSEYLIAASITGFAAAFLMVIVGWVVTTAEDPTLTKDIAGCVDVLRSAGPLSLQVAEGDPDKYCKYHAELAYKQRKWLAQHK